MIRTAILGYGRNGSTMHAGALEKNKDFEVVAVCDIDKNAQEKASKRFGCPVYDDYIKMLSEIKPQFVVIVTRSSQHAQMSIDCLMAGCDVLVTKPWATTAYDAQRMIDAQKISGHKLFPWLPARFGTDLVKIKEIIEKGEIGKVFEIRRSTTTFGKRFDWQTLNEFGGGYLLNWGPHLIDQPLQLTNSDVDYVYGNLRQIINPGDTEDNFRVITHLKDGTTVISEFLIATGPYPSWVIQGNRGTIIANGTSIQVNKVEFPENVDKSAYRTEVIKSNYEIKVEGSIYGDENEIYVHIAKALRNEEPYFVELKSALRLSKIIDAAKLSSKTKAVCKL